MFTIFATLATIKASQTKGSSVREISIDELISRDNRRASMDKYFVVLTLVSVIVVEVVVILAV